MERISGPGHVNNRFVTEDAATNRAPTEVTASWLNAVQEEIVSVILAAGLPLNPASFGQLYEAVQRLIDAQSGNYVLDTGAANAYVVAINPPVSAYANGMTVRFRVVNGNTGASTLNAGAGALPLVNDVAGALVNGDLPAGCIASATYDGNLNKFLINSLVTSQAMSMATADGRYAAMAGLATQIFRAANAAGANDVIPLGQADGRYAPLNGFGTSGNWPIGSKIVQNGTGYIQLDDVNWGVVYRPKVTGTQFAGKSIHLWVNAAGGYIAGLSDDGVFHGAAFEGQLYGNAATATTLNGSEADWANLRAHTVANMLGWKNFGNGHVIFDASNGTAPNGAVVNNINPQVPWSPLYPNLMGWNGGTTYGVRVDSARFADTFTGVSAGNNVIYQHPTGGSASSTTPAEVVNMRMCHSGTYRIGYTSTDAGVDGRGTYSQIYRNGVAVGTLNVVGDAAHTGVFTQDFAFSAGDTMQILTWTSVAPVVATVSAVNVSVAVTGYSMIPPTTLPIGAR